jgi:hypothetical protein
MHEDPEDEFGDDFGSDKYDTNFDELLFNKVLGEQQGNAHLPNNQADAGFDCDRVEHADCPRPVSGRQTELCRTTLAQILLRLTLRRHFFDKHTC